MTHPMKSLLLAAALLPSAALAHPGHVHDAHESGAQFLHGLAHPVGGADHLLAMVALGLLAAQLGGRAVWALPVTFVGAMLVGGAMGAGGMSFPAVEPMILASVVILGVMVAVAARLPMAALLPMVAVFGAGFALATMALHLGGIAFGRLLSRGLELRVLGGGTALAGIALTVA